MVDIDFWAGKRVLITGHTGFKGAWLSQWLIGLGANVTGLALAPNTKTNLYNILNLEAKLNSVIGDISDLEVIYEIIHVHEPEIIFHLAAQSLVHDSYEDPIGTLKTNIIGTSNILQATRENKTVKVIINVTSDKCYQNDELSVAFKETDRMGGNDIYSCSKGCSELITNAFRKSFYERHQAVLATVRAGNVIGGGDWSKNRLVPDIIRAFSRGEKVKLRNPMSIRPWQYVLEPLSGYLLLAEKIYGKGREYEGAWNFGPGSTGEITVQELTRRLSEVWGEGSKWAVVENTFPPESNFLKLDCTKAIELLGWNPRLSIAETIAWTAGWYKRMYQKEDMEAYTRAQIKAYMERG